jgi:hypothetical protein
MSKTGKSKPARPSTSKDVLHALGKISKGKAPKETSSAAPTQETPQASE